MYFFSRNHHFISPPRVESKGFNYIPEKGIKTYSDYNYLRPGISSFLRTRHFEYALRLTRAYFHKCNVIDFGCGDGPFLPSLARYFNWVLGVDNNTKFIELAEKVIQAARLENIKLICSQGLTIEHLKAKIGNEKYQILFLLEVLEHVGDKRDPWISRVNFLKELTQLISEDGVIVISVPKMVGPAFFLQRLGLCLLSSQREPISMSNLFWASFLNNTDNLERQWNGGHLGFNHKRLATHLKKEFLILRKKDLMFQQMYVCQRRSNNG